MQQIRDLERKIEKARRLLHEEAEAYQDSQNEYLQGLESTMNDKAQQRSVCLALPMFLSIDIYVSINLPILFLFSIATRYLKKFCTKDQEIFVKGTQIVYLILMTRHTCTYTHSHTHSPPHTHTHRLKSRFHRNHLKSKASVEQQRKKIEKLESQLRDLREGVEPHGKGLRVMSLRYGRGMGGGDGRRGWEGGWKGGWEEEGMGGGMGGEIGGRDGRGEGGGTVESV